MQKRKAWLLISLILAVLVSGALIWHNQSQPVLQNITTDIAQQLSKSLGQPVKIGNIVINSPTSMTLQQVEIEDPEGQPILVSSEVKVSFSLWELFWGHEPAIHMIKEIQITAPQLFITEGADGKWNVDQLLKEKPADQPSLRSLIDIDQGSVNLTLPQGSWTLDHLTGKVNLENASAAAVDLAGEISGNTFTVAGRLNDGGTHHLRIQAPMIDVQSFLPLLCGQSQLDKIQVHEGKLTNFTLSVVSEKDKPLVFSGESELKEFAVSLDGRELQQIHGFVTFTQEHLDFYHTEATWGNQLFAISGQVLFNTDEPVIHLSITGANLDLSALPLPIEAAGRLSVAVQVAGRVSQPVIDGTVSVQDLKADGYTVNQGRAHIHLADQELSLQHLSADLLGGTLTGNGQVDLASATGSLHFSGRHIDSAALVAAADIPVSGYSDFDADVSGPFDPAQAVVSAQVVMTEGTFQAVSFYNLQTAFVKTAAGDILIDQASAVVAGGKLLAQGTVGRENLDLSVMAQQIQADSLAPNFTDASIKGAVTVSGHVTGTRTEPLVAAQFLAENGEVLNQPFDTLTGAFTATSQQVSIDHATLTYNQPFWKNQADFRIPPVITTHQVSGTVGLTGDHAVQLAIKTHAARAEDLVKFLAPDQDVTGNVDADVLLSGPLANPDAKVAAYFTDGSYRGYLVRHAEALLVRKQGLTKIDRLTVHSLPGDLELSGTMDDNQVMNFAVDIKNIRMNHLGLDFPYPLTGRANFSGQLTGTPDHPIFDGQLLAQKLTVKGQEITNVSGFVLLDGQDIRIPSLEFHQGEGLVQVSGGMNLQNRTLSGTADFTNGSVSQLAPLFDIASDKVTGKLNGQIRASGSLDNPTVFLTGNLTGGTIKKYPLDSVDLDLEMVNHVISINQFAAKQGAGHLIITGTADLNGPVHLNVYGSSIDSGLFPAWLDMNIPVHGDALVSVEVTGDIKNPTAAVSVGVQNGSIDNQKFDSLNGSFIVTNKLIDINQITLTKDAYVVSATGTVPIQNTKEQEPLSPSFNFPTHFSSISNRLIGNNEMDIKIMLDQADLGILPFMTRQIAWAGGATQGNLVINGTPSQPKLFGNLAVQKGTVKFASLKDAMTDLTLDIHFEGDKIVINTFQGKMGQGNFTLAGSALLKGKTLTDYDLKMKLNQLGIRHANFNGPVSGELALSSVSGQPLLSGKIRLEQDDIDIPAIPEIKPAVFDLALNVDVEAGKNLRLYNPYLYDFNVDGKVNIGGSLKQPRPSGKFTVTHGKLTYLTAPFTIETGTADFIPYSGLIPVIHLTSQYQIQQTTVTLAINGPATEMDFKLTSNPALSQPQIMSLLTLRNRYFDKQLVNGRDNNFGRDQMDSLVTFGLESQLFSPVENSLRSIFGFDDFHVVHNYDTVSGVSSQSAITQEVYDLEVSKYLTDKLLVNYSIGIDHTSQKFGFRYEFNQQFSIGTSQDSLHHYKVDALAKYQF